MSLFRRSLSLAHHALGGARQSELTAQEGAELYWDMPDQPDKAE
jgi:hypothetical protein